jgi:NAD-dependent dihydropyrimidine dehydrogenase PreA subunit
MAVRERPRPFLVPRYCKGCERCIEACAKKCIELAPGIHPETGLVPVVVHLDDCTACGLCIRLTVAPLCARDLCLRRTGGRLGLMGTRPPA